jgi:signal transduction histidine kinase
VALLALAAGHGLMRSRARRVAAAQDAARARQELALQARVGDCEQRRQSLAAFARLASHVAHEVRNPLSAIMLNTELLEEEAAKCQCDNAEAQALVASIKTEAERLQHLTDECLAFARPPRPAAAHQSLNAVAEELAHLVREEARRSAITVETRMSHDCPCAIVDPHQIKQADLNLVRNATQAMPEGGRLTISTGVEADGSVTLSVDDTGPGIPEELRCQIFEPFFTSKPPGTGLGLPLAAHIVRDHGGEIVFSQAPSTATVLIEGPSGTGKELVAEALHALSPRRDKPLVKVNCGAIPETLLEAELFGHEKGAFTGALARKDGRFARADGGTLFLDEVGTLTLPVQAKLLRALQDGTFEPLGSTRTLQADCRIIAATNTDLA